MLSHYFILKRLLFSCSMYIFCDLEFSVIFLLKWLGPLNF